jgi:hypothetical protein
MSRAPPVSNGQWLVLVHIAVTYWFPCLANLWLHDEIQSSYVIEDLTTSTIVTLLTMPLLALLLVRGAERLTGAAPGPNAGRVSQIWVSRYQRARPALAVVTFLCGAYLTITGQSNYRYSSTEISEISSIPLFLALTLNAVGAADLFVCMFVRPSLGHATARHAFATWLFALNSVISASGVAALFQGLLFLTYAAAPRVFERMVIARPHRTVFRKALTLMQAGAIVTTLFAMAWLGGQIIKGTSSVDVGEAAVGTRESVGAEYFLSDFRPYLVERLSIYYYSVLYTAADPTLRDATDVNAVMLPLSTLAFRIDYVLGSPFGIARPVTSSISQLNYLRLSHLARSEREGSSPGVIASFRYVAPPPFDALLCAVYLAIVGLWVTRISTDLRYSLVGLVLLAETMRGLFQSPLDLIIVLDEGTFYLLLAAAYAVAVVRAGRVPLASQVSSRRRPLVGDATLGAPISLGGSR